MLYSEYVLLIEIRRDIWWHILYDHRNPRELDISLINTLRPRQNGRHFADDIFKGIFLNENIWIPIKISLKFVPKGPVNNIPALVQIMAWRRPGDKPLSEPMMVCSPTHICVTRPQWLKTNLFLSAATLMSARMFASAEVAVMVWGIPIINYILCYDNAKDFTEGPHHLLGFVLTPNLYWSNPFSIPFKP